MCCQERNKYWRGNSNRERNTLRKEKVQHNLLHFSLKLFFQKWICIQSCEETSPDTDTRCGHRFKVNQEVLSKSNISTSQRESCMTGTCSMTMCWLQKRSTSSETASTPFGVSCCHQHDQCAKAIRLTSTRWPSALWAVTRHSAMF